MSKLVKNVPGIAEGSIAYEILRYLETYPQAQDTVEGITEWWLLEQRIVNTLQQVQASVDELVAQNRLVVRRGLDGRVSYRLNPQFLRDSAPRQTHSNAGMNETPTQE